MTIQKLFEMAGGTLKLALVLNVHQWTVQRWEKNGIPYKYLEILKKKYGLDANDLEEINRRIRK